MTDRAHKQEYDVIRADYPSLPEWDALTEEQKEKVREANKEKWAFFHELGQAISTGGALPDPFGNKQVREPSQLAQESMNDCTDDTSWVFVQQTGEKWVVSVWDDPIEWTDTQGRGWHSKPDPRPEKRS